jgi:hypothetical protein
MLVVLAAIALVLLVILEVFDAINVGNVAIVEELTPPILFTVGKLAVPPKSFVSFNIPFTLEVASGALEPPTNAATNAVVANCVELVPGAAVGAVGVPVNDGEAIVARNNISAALAVILAVLEIIAFVLLVILAAFAVIAFVLLVILAVFDIILVSKAFSAFVALVISAMIFAVLAVIAFVLLVMLAVFEAIAFVLLVILAVFDVILVFNVFSAFVALVISAVILAVLAAMAFVLLVILAVFDAISVGNIVIVAELTPPTELMVVANVPVPLPLTSPINVIN